MGPTTRQWRRAALALAAGLVVHLDGISAAAQSSSSSSKSSIVQTKNYIDTISGYTDLSTCAELVLSTVVRGEYSGCADTYALTSYTCFCTDSSSYMSAVISRDVLSSCDDSYASAQASSALGVFDAYCALGVPAGLTTQQAVGGGGGDASATSTPTPAASVATITVSASSTPSTTPTTTSSSSSSSSSGLSDTTTAILVGVLVSVFGVLAVLTACYIYWRHKRALLARAHAEGDGGTLSSAPPRKGVVEVAAYERPAEMPALEPRHEAPAYESAVELPGFEAQQHGRPPQEVMGAAWVPGSDR